MAAARDSMTRGTKRGLCLLSLGTCYQIELHKAFSNMDEDGGGIRGLSELIIIEELMERIKWKEKLDKTPIPADYFDLIGGTSTGGYTHACFNAFTVPLLIP